MINIQLIIINSFRPTCMDFKNCIFGGPQESYTVSKTKPDFIVEVMETLPYGFPSFITGRTSPKKSKRLSLASYMPLQLKNTVLPPCICMRRRHDSSDHLLRRNYINTTAKTIYYDEYLYI